MPARLALTAALTCALTTAAGASETDLGVGIQCWEGTSEADPVDRLVFLSPGTAFGCRILLSNRSGEALEDLTIAMVFGESEPVPLTPALPEYDQDPWARFMCFTEDTGATSFRYPIVSHLRAAYPGFPTGTVQNHVTSVAPCRYRDAESRADWTLARLEPGASVTLRTQFVSGAALAGSDFSALVTVRAGNVPPGLSVDAPDMPIDVVYGLPPLRNEVWGAPDLFAEGALVGHLVVGHGPNTSPAYSGVHVDLFLPYLRADADEVDQLHLDGAFDPDAGDVLLFDPDDLDLAVHITTGVGGNFARRIIDRHRGEDLSEASPAPHPIAEVNPSHLRVPMGLLTGLVGSPPHRLLFSWGAAFLRTPRVQAFLADRGTLQTGRWCVRTDQTGQPEADCRTATSALRTEEAVVDRYAPLFFGVTAGVGQTEGLAVRPLNTAEVVVRSGMSVWRGVTARIKSQVFIDERGLATTPTRLSSTSGTPVLISPPTLAVSTTGTDFGSPEDIRLRQIPAFDAAFVHAGDIPLSESWRELLFECELSRYHVRSHGSFACSFGLQQLVPREATASIDGVSSTFDLTHMSLGAKAIQEFRDEGGAILHEDVRSVAIEVDPSSLYSVFVARRGGPTRIQQATVQGVLDRAPLQPANHGCFFGNRGLDNIRGPVTLTLAYPLGWEPDLGPDLAELDVMYAAATPGSAAVTIDGTRPVPAERFSATIDRESRTIAVTFDGPQADGTFSGSDAELDPATYESARSIAFVAPGSFQPGSERFPTLTCTADIAEVVTVTGAQVPDQRATNPTAVWRVIGPAAPLIEGTSSPLRLPTRTAFVSDIVVRNPAWDSAGVRLTDGASLSAREAVVFARIPRVTTPGSARFDFAQTDEAAHVWVSAVASPQEVRGAALGPDTGWLLCAEAGAPCDGEALAGLGLTPAEVRWVAFDLGELLVTDAEPRGVRPRLGAARVENPYLLQVGMVDLGSPDGAILSPRVSFASLDTLTLLQEAGAFDVAVFDGCDGAELGQGCAEGTGRCERDGVVRCDLVAESMFCDAVPGQPEAERCDGEDWDCDGEPLNGFESVGTACAEGVGQCRQEGAFVCRPDGTGVLCDAVPGEPVAEMCDGLDNDCNGQTDDLPGTGQTCLVGIGRCAAQGVTVCDPGGASTHLCVGVPGEPEAERCDDEDWNCDGNPHTGFDVGAACEVHGEGCVLTGVKICSADGLGTVCDIGEEACPPCVLEEGEPCAVGVGACRREGLTRCDPDDDGAVICGVTPGEPGVEVCDGADNDCNGIVDDAADDCSCDGITGSDSVCPGVYDPAQADGQGDGVGDVCDCALRDGEPCLLWEGGCIRWGTLRCEAGVAAGVCVAEVPETGAGDDAHGGCLEAGCGEIPPGLCGIQAATQCTLVDGRGCTKEGTLGCEPGDLVATCVDDGIAEWVCEPEVEPGPETGPEAVAEVEPVPETGPEAVAEVEPVPEEGPEAVAEIQPEPVAEVEPAPEAGPEAVADVEPEPAPEPGPEVMDPRDGLVAHGGAACQGGAGLALPLLSLLLLVAARRRRRA